MDNCRQGAPVWPNKLRNMLIIVIILAFGLSAGFYATRYWIPKAHIQYTYSICSAIEITARDPNNLYRTLQDRLTYRPPSVASVIECLDKSLAWKSRTARSVALAATVFLQVRNTPIELRVREGTYDEKVFFELTDSINKYIVLHSYEIKENDDYGLMIRKAIETQLKLLDKKWIDAKYEASMEKSFKDQGLQESLKAIHIHSSAPAQKIYQGDSFWFP